MIPESDMLKYGALGFGFLVLFLILWLIVRPIILSFVTELQASREERVEQREQFLSFMQNHAMEQVAAMHEIKQGLSEITVTLQRLNGHSGGKG